MGNQKYLCELLIGLLQIIPKNINLEINISCPNTEKHMINEGIHVFLNDRRKWCIIKLSPLTSVDSIDKYYTQGFRQFHCSNTLPTPSGGASGQLLIPYTSNMVKFINNKYDDCTIIAGGGIYDVTTMNTYKSLGASIFSVSTIFFHPTKWGPFFYHYYQKK